MPYPHQEPEWTADKPEQWLTLVTSVLEEKYDINLVRVVPSVD
jgi:hypothetical protein